MHLNDLLFLQYFEYNNIFKIDVPKMLQINFDMYSIRVAENINIRHILLFYNLTQKISYVLTEYILSMMHIVCVFSWFSIRCKYSMGYNVHLIPCHFMDFAMGGKGLDSVIAKLQCWYQMSHLSICCSHGNYLPQDKVQSARCMSKYYLPETEMLSFW